MELAPVEKGTNVYLLSESGAGDGKEQEKPRVFQSDDPNEIFGSFGFAGNYTREFRDALLEEGEEDPRIDFAMAYRLRVPVTAGQTRGQPVGQPSHWWVVVRRDPSGVDDELRQLEARLGGFFRASLLLILALLGLLVTFFWFSQKSWFQSRLTRFLRRQAGLPSQTGVGTQNRRSTSRSDMAGSGMAGSGSERVLERGLTLDVTLERTLEVEPPLGSRVGNGSRSAGSGSAPTIRGTISSTLGGLGGEEEPGRSLLRGPATGAESGPVDPAREAGEPRRDES
jgi:hypothetical protein